jgi:hypothetical protein
MRMGVNTQKRNDEHHDTPHDALIKALEKVEDMDDVLIIYNGQNHSGSFDSGLTIERAVFMIEVFKTWLLAARAED